MNKRKTSSPQSGLEHYQPQRYHNYHYNAESPSSLSSSSASSLASRSNVNFSFNVKQRTSIRLVKSNSSGGGGGDGGGEVGNGGRVAGGVVGRHSTTPMSTNSSMMITKHNRIIPNVHHSINYSTLMLAETGSKIHSSLALR